MVFAAFNPRRKTRSLGHLGSSLSFPSFPFSIYIFCLNFGKCFSSENECMRKRSTRDKKNKYVIPLEVTSERCTVNGAE